MRISTIVTVYNLEKFIEDCLCSIFAQTLQPDEIIVVDDCSADNSAGIIKKYIDRVTYIKMPQNSGVLLAFIRGIEEATGDILSFLDGDDIWHTNKLEEITKAFSADKNRILVTHDYECINGNGNSRLYNNDNTHQNTAEIVKKSKGNPDKMNTFLRNAILCNKGVWLGSAFCLNKKYFDIPKFKSLMLSLPDAELAYQDHPAAAFILLENINGKVFYIDKILFKYRMFGNNHSGKSNDIASALRTIKKSQANNARTSNLVAQHPYLIEENKRQKSGFLYNSFLEELYTKKYPAAIKKYFSLWFNVWGFKKKIHETWRLLAVIILGPDKFLRIK
jgi:glycosyltransferase involved in cell wall biosynthesis